jgi:hypothetical protein
MMTRIDFEKSFLTLTFTKRSSEYLVHLSPKVSVKINTTIQSDNVIKFTSVLWSESLNRVLNSKDFPKLPESLDVAFKVVNHWKAIYEAKTHFYEKQIHMTPEELQQYQIEMSVKIQSIPDWDKSDFYKENLQKVSNGQVLSDKVLSMLNKKYTPVKKVLSEEQVEFQNKINALCSASQAKGDEWTHKFSLSILDGIKRFGPKATFTQRQKDLIAKKLTEYNIL